MKYKYKYKYPAAAGSSAVTSVSSSVSAAAVIECEDTDHGATITYYMTLDKSFIRIIWNIIKIDLGKGFKKSMEISLLSLTLKWSKMA